MVALGVLVMNLPAIIGRRSPAPRLLAPEVFIDSAPAAPGVPPPESAAVAAALARVIDPELDLAITELGLVERQLVDSAGNAAVLLVLTTPECPYARLLGSQAVAELKLLPGIRRIELRLDPTIQWQPGRLSEEGRRRFRRRFGDGRNTGR